MLQVCSRHPKLCRWLLGDLMFFFYLEALTLTEVFTFNSVWHEPVGPMVLGVAHARLCVALEEFVKLLLRNHDVTFKLATQLLRQFVCF